MSNVLNLISTYKTCSYKVGCDLPGKYRVALDSDALMFGGYGRVSNVNNVQDLFCNQFVLYQGPSRLHQIILFAMLICAASQVGHDVDHFTSPEGVPGVPETNFNNRPNSFRILSPPRTCVVMLIP